ncbi:hypothetical protein RABR111495_14365 [Rahnella bruchi]
MMDLDAPDHLNPKALQTIHYCLRLTEAINQLEAACESRLLDALREEMSIQCFRLAPMFDDPDTRRGLFLRAEILADDSCGKTVLPQIAGLNEQQLVLGIGNTSTWVGKSKQSFYSSWFGEPAPVLQEISDVMDSLFPESLLYLQKEIAADLLAMPGCAYKIINLFGIAGEANTYPKHFAYFFPEDEGLKYSPVKRTVVFANTYLQLFELFSRTEAAKMGWAEEALPDSQVCQRYLIAWFRGHDLGHSLVRNENVFPKLSKIDRWGSMMVQEALADQFGLLMCLTPQIADGLQLDRTVLARIYFLEMLRYLRRGPSSYPDAGAAWIQFNYLREHGCIELKTGSIDFHPELFFTQMAGLTRLMSEELLGGDTERAQAFMQQHCPHTNPEDVEVLMARLGTTNDMIEYNQLIKRVPL